jgi:CRISPR-associated protein Cas2
MVVMILEKVPPSLRGALTRWLLEVRPHVYVGTTSARVGDRLWERAVKHSKGGSVVQITSSRTEQGFHIRSHGNPTYQPRDFEGITLITRPGRGQLKEVADAKSGVSSSDRNIS